MTDDEYISAVRRNSQRLFLIALSFTKTREDSEDILQNVFLKLWKNTNTFQDETHTDKWLTAVCVNECRNCIKSPFRKKSVSFDESYSEIEFNCIESQDIFNAVMSLPKKERTAIHLFYYEDLSVKEISKLFNQNESSVKTRLCRARKN